MSKTSKNSLFSINIVHIFLLLTLGTLVPSSCKRAETFPTLGDQVASPVDVAVAPGEGYFYALNADFDRTFNAGSILVIDTEGNKKSAISVPRLGRNIAIAGNDMLVTFDADGTSRGAEAILFDVSTPEAPREITRLDLGCSPLNTVMRQGYKHFAIACENAGDAGG
ncbi:MAG: hypothetical protein EBU49_13780, partial [Proteobacteria bacterium]|nr:hypothetical protein [Pseudomonadota bacterium]